MKIYVQPGAIAGAARWSLYADDDSFLDCGRVVLVSENTQRALRKARKQAEKQAEAYIKAGQLSGEFPA